MKFSTFIITLCTLLGATDIYALAARPRLVVNIVVSSLRADDLRRYDENFSDGGFRLLQHDGVSLSNYYSSFSPTLTSAALATITTGANPSLHGVIGNEWFDATTRQTVSLTADSRMTSAYGNHSECAHSPLNLTAETLGDALRYVYPKSKSVSIAPDAQSAVVMGGKSALALWLDSASRWVTSSYYATILPQWVEAYNNDDLNHALVSYSWYGKYLRERYRNTRASHIILYGNGEKQSRPTISISGNNISEYLQTTPAGNTAVFEFAKRAVSDMQLGVDTNPDILNICLDTSRHIVEKYGPESVEYEDMLYCLDGTLADFLIFLRAQFKNPDDLLVVLTSDHGTSPSYTTERGDKERFNARQFEVIINAFLSARYGQSNWITGYRNGSLYLNPKTVFDHGKTLREVQTEVATFALQFRGVAHALTATALMENYFGSGYGMRMQNGFYPRRSGDVVIDLMPEWIEEQDDMVSLSGSPYGYDTHLPLIIYGGGVSAEVCRERADMTDLAPTLAHLLGIGAPAASEGRVIDTIKTK